MSRALCYFPLIPAALVLVSCSGGTAPRAAAGRPQNGGARPAPPAEEWTATNRPAWVARRPEDAKLAQSVLKIEAVIQEGFGEGFWTALSVNPNVVRMPRSAYDGRPLKELEGNVVIFALYFEAKGFGRSVELRDADTGEVVAGFRDGRALGRIAGGGGVTVPPSLAGTQKNGPTDPAAEAAAELRRKLEERRAAAAERKRKEAEAQQRQRDEEYAAAQVKYAKKLIGEGDAATAKERLEKVVKDYGDTKAAPEARELLKELK
jgi:hypothetical protein